MVMSETGKSGRNLKAPEINKEQLFPGFTSIATGRSKVHFCSETSLLLRDQASWQTAFYRHSGSTDDDCLSISCPQEVRICGLSKMSTITRWLVMKLKTVMPLRTFPLASGQHINFFSTWFCAKVTAGRIKFPTISAIFCVLC